MTPFHFSGRYLITTEKQTFLLSTGETVTVPAGYLFDGHTLPPFLLPFINPYSYDVYAALLHDYLYEYRIGTRAQADYEYLYFMKQLGANWLRRYTFYIGVRVFGWIWWYT